MKFVFFSCMLMIPVFLFADAGFNIGRAKAPCHAVFTGINKLNNYVFISSNEKSERKKDTLKENDTIPIYYAQGEKWWKGPIKIVVQDKQTQQNIDSFTLVAEGENLAINFTGVENNKLKYAVEKTKAEYPYALYGDEKVNGTSAIRNKYILIALSAMGFLILLFMFFKKNNNRVNKTTA